MRQITGSTLCLVALSLGVGAQAHAFDVNAGAAATKPASYLSTRTGSLPTHVVEQRYYRDSTPVVPAEAPVQPLAMPQPAPEMVTARADIAPTATPREELNIQYKDPNDTSSYDADRYTVEVEGFYDVYREKIPVTPISEYGAGGSINGSYMHYFNPRAFAGIEARASYESSDYKGYLFNGTPFKVSDTRAWEFEPRVLGGYEWQLGNGANLKTYTGLGLRIFSQNNKEQGSYDRRIFQIYAPIGATLNMPFYGMTISPNAEIDPLLWGFVNSRLQNLGGPDARNVQTSGLGVRGEIMVGQIGADGKGWQMGPFVRYWNIQDSNVDDSSGGLYEPKNNRAQAGIKVRMLY